jgi:hypothetical protein
LAGHVESSPADGVHFCLDAKTNQKDQGWAGFGYLRSICAEILETRSQARSDSEDFLTLRFRSGRDADSSKAGRLEDGRVAGPGRGSKEMV